MTKREKKLCSSPGCHRKALINIQVLHNVLHKDLPINEAYFCDSHFIEYLGFMSSYFMGEEDCKEMLIEGISLHSKSKETVRDVKGNTSTKSKG